MSKKLEQIKTVLDSIQSRVDDMCKDICKKDNLDYEKVFGEFDISKKDKEENKTETKSDSEEQSKENKETQTKSFVLKESINAMCLYDKARFIFESENGYNEDGSDYGFNDYIRETIDTTASDINESEYSLKYYGGMTVVNEGDLTIDDFRRMHKDWVDRGSDMNALNPDASMDNKDAEFKKLLKKILDSRKNNDSMDSNGDGFISKKEFNKHIENNTDVNGKVPNEVLLKDGLKQAKAGVNNYLNQFMPMSWITGTENAIGKAAGKVGNKIKNSSVGKLYRTAGGNKALALGALGGLAFGLPGAIGGALLGKGLQKIVNYGNGVRS